ncbi:ABC transporter permease subunit [Crocinitomicaceae bacterium]|nr:ABC transporter permease subunit [Crocinitomicaceae bacterium]
MIFTIFKKELKDTLRDKRTLMMMLVIPILIFPIILNVFVSISSSFSEDAATKEINIGFVGTPDNYLLKQIESIPENLGEKKIIIYSDSSALKRDVKSDSLQVGMFTSVSFNDNLTQKKPAEVIVYHNVTSVGMEQRGRVYVDIVKDIALQERYLDMDLKESELTPIVSEYSNVASNKEMIGKLAGGILPYIFIAFGFLGCMYPAIDLFTGEKERGTIETLLTTPVARWQILFGKMGVVVSSGLLAASAALFGLFLSIEVLDIVENEELLSVIHGILNLKFVLLMFGLLFPLTVFFAGIMIPVAVYAKSFKEAQSIITPINLVVVLPAMVGFFPGIELTPLTASIPVVNIVLATKELIAGTLEFWLLGISFAVMIAIAVIAVFISFKRFDKESNIVI